MAEYEHKKFAVGFEVSINQLRKSAAAAGMTLEQFLERLAREPGVEIELVQYEGVR